MFWHRNCTRVRVWRFFGLLWHDYVTDEKCSCRQALVTICHEAVVFEVVNV